MSECCVQSLAAELQQAISGFRDADNGKIDSGHSSGNNGMAYSPLRSPSLRATTIRAATEVSRAYTAGRHTAHSWNVEQTQGARLGLALCSLSLSWPASNGTTSSTPASRSMPQPSRSTVRHGAEHVLLNAVPAPSLDKLASMIRLVQQRRNSTPRQLDRSPTIPVATNMRVHTSYPMA